MVPYDMTISEFNIGFAFAGADTVTVGIWTEDKTTLVDSASGTTVSSTDMTATIGATLTGGEYYWFGAKCANGVSDFFKNTGFSNSSQTMSLFNSGIPASITSASAANVAPKIVIRG